MEYCPYCFFRNFLTFIYLRERQQTIENERLKVCKKAAENYIPHGLLSDIPDEWNCPWDQLINIPNKNGSKPLFGKGGILEGNVKNVLLFFSQN